MSFGAIKNLEFDLIREKHVLFVVVAKSTKFEIFLVAQHAAEFVEEAAVDDDSWREHLGRTVQPSAQKRM